MQIHPKVIEFDGHGDVVQVQQLGALVDQHALGQAGRPAGVHEDDGIGLLRFGRRRPVSRRR